MNDKELDVIDVCIAYEQGYGHGITNRDLTNPYKHCDDLRIAWTYGYNQGNIKWKLKNE